MNMPKNLDLLQNIEFMIVQFYRKHSDLPDYDVDDALAALVDDYRKDPGYPTREHRLKGYAGDIYAGVRAVLELRVGSGIPGGIAEAGDPPNTRQEVVTALGTVRKSVQRHGKTGGRQGYLRFIDSMMP
jgi:hypothetical protein